MKKFLLIALVLSAVALDCSQAAVPRNCDAGIVGRYQKFIDYVQGFCTKLPVRQRLACWQATMGFKGTKAGWETYAQIMRVIAYDSPDAWYIHATLAAKKCYVPLKDFNFHNFYPCMRTECTKMIQYINN